MHQKFLKKVIDLACENVLSGKGGPFAAIVVKDGEIISEGTNLVTSTNDPTAHAEVVAIRNACKKLNTFQLENCTIYSSCEPCPMCLGAIYWARPKQVIFAATKDDAAKAGFDDSLIYEQINIPGAERIIPFVQISIDNNCKPFDVWLRTENKKKY